MNNQNTNPGAATLVFAKCTNCGAEMQVNASLECTICPGCGQPFVTVKGIQNYNAQRGIGAAAPAAFTPPQEPPKKRRTWLWVLGWIFCFPIPLTILMMRNKTMNPKAKYGIIAAGWVGFLIIMAASRADSNRSTSAPPVSDTGTGIVTEAPAEKPKTEPTPAKTEPPATKAPETEPQVKAAPKTEPPAEEILQTEAPRTEAPATEPTEQYQKIDIDTLESALENNAAAAKVNYKGKYLEVTGRLGVIDSDLSYIVLLSTTNEWDFTGVHCTLSKKAVKEKVMTLSTDQTIVVRGKITDVGEVLGFFMDIDEIIA